MLDMTPAKVVARKGATINPCKTCEPVGALYCALGIHKCMPHSHGSQGCCSYHRTILGRHFKEPAIATSSSFTEGASVFGGRSNLNTSVKNIFDIYNPDIIAVHTTCLSETIGDDVQSYLTDLKIPEGKRVIYASTPSYEGSHIQGFSNMMCAIVNQMAVEEPEANGRVAVFPGWVEPGDCREMKRLAKLLKANPLLLPDHDNTMDTPMTGRYEYYGEGGTKIPEIAQIGGSRALLALGHIISGEVASLMLKKFEFPTQLLPLPVGIAFTDHYVLALKNASGADVPAELQNERGRLVDLLLDSSPYTNGKKVAVYGDPDIVYAMTSLCLEMGMVPKYVITGTPKKEFETLAEELLGKYGLQDECTVKSNADLFYMHQLIKNEPVDLLLGSSYGKYIAKAEDIPIVRMGFPVLDRYAGPLQPVVGYRGAIRMAERILEALMARQDRDAADEDFEAVL